MNNRHFAGIGIALHMPDDSHDTKRWMARADGRWVRGNVAVKEQLRGRQSERKQVGGVIVRFCLQQKKPIWSAICATFDR